MKLAVIGTGRVGGAIAPTIVAAGHEVVCGGRDPVDPKHAGGDAIHQWSTPDAAAWALIGNNA